MPHHAVLPISARFAIVQYHVLILTFIKFVVGSTSTSASKSNTLICQLIFFRSLLKHDHVVLLVFQWFLMSPFQVFIVKWLLASEG